VSTMRLLAFSAAFALASPVAMAAEPLVVEGDDLDDDADLRVERLPQIDVIGRRAQDVRSVPGSAAIVTEEDLRHQAPLSANEALRGIPGLSVRDEEGLGLRPNFGVRGLNPDRGRTLLVLEDGVPVSLAPYGEPELYYAPSIERMQRLELVKGSGSILFGPQTIGGVLNYITADPPRDLTLEAEARVGTHGYYLGRVAIGDTVGNVGYRFSVMHQRFAGHRGLNLELTDVDAKLRLELSPRSFLGLKLAVYDELSNATYVGLTTPQFEADPSANHAVHDVLPVRRYSASATHNVMLSDAVLLQTTLYGYHTTRNWTRQDFDRSFVEGRAYERIIDGQNRDVTGQGGYADDGSALFFRGTTGSRNRAFTVAGLEPRVTWDYRLGESARGELIGGVRLHSEVTSEQRLDGTTASTISGAMREDERRHGLALAAYVQNRFVISERLRISPGLRMESLWHGREVHRARVDGTPTDFDPPRTEDSHVFALIPGLGLSWSITDEVTLFAGVHRGFAPPRTKDAITNDGQNLELEAEFSWNYELGLRLGVDRGLWAEVTGFVLDFQNQVIPPTEASGILTGDAGAAERQLINGGDSLHAGAEIGVTFDPGRFFDLGFQLPLTLSYTYVHAEFGDTWAEGIAGNRLPYAPEHMVGGQLRFVHGSGLSLQANAHWIDAQFHDKANTVEATANGTNGIIPSRFLLDARVGFNLKEATGSDVELYVLAKNLTDAQYIASRAPQGIQPGMFRHIVGGVRGRF